MYHVMDVARFIVNYSINIGRPVSNLKLQKLLYFLQALWLFLVFFRQLSSPFCGVTAFGSLFTNMHNIGRFKLAFTVSLIGFVIFNLIFMFLYVLAKLLKREISSSENEEIVGRWGFTRWLKRVWVRYPYMFMFNAVMLVILVTGFVAWYGATCWSWKI